MRHRMRHLLVLAAHHRFRGIAHTNVNAVHQESMTRNDRIASRVATVVGTMAFCYGLAALMLAWALLQTVILGRRAFDPYPFAFLFFCLGGIMQSLLMPLLMVKSNLDGRHSELMAEQSAAATQEILGKLTEIVEKLK